MYKEIIENILLYENSDEEYEDDEGLYDETSSKSFNITPRKALKYGAGLASLGLGALAIKKGLAARNITKTAVKPLEDTLSKNKRFAYKIPFIGKVVKQSDKNKLEKITKLRSNLRTGAGVAGAGSLAGAGIFLKTKSDDDEISDSDDDI